jgi:flagellar protein FlbD
MIAATRLDGREVIINCGHIVTVERTPDTVIELTTGQRIMVRETAEQVVARTVEYRRRIAEGAFRVVETRDDEANLSEAVDPDEPPVVEEAGE